MIKKNYKDTKYQKTSKSLQHCATGPLLLPNQHNMKHWDIIPSTTLILLSKIFLKKIEH